MRRGFKGRRRWLWTAPACLGVVVTVSTVNLLGGAGNAEQTRGAPAPCVESSGQPGPVKPTTIDTLEQAYYCVFAHYFGGNALDGRRLLQSAFIGFSQELARSGLERPDAMPPALTGDRAKDWAAFRAVYQRVTEQLPARPDVRQAVAAATMNGILRGLHDNHVGWRHPEPIPNREPGQTYGLGFATSPSSTITSIVPDSALPPMHITAVTGGPAAERRLRPGDVIESVNGAPPFVDGALSPGAIDRIYQEYPRQDRVRLTVNRPSTGRTWTVELKPRLFRPDPDATAIVTSELLRGDVASVRLAAFAQGAADQVLAAVRKLGEGRRLRGVVLDLRGNNGGAATEVTRLLGAFSHGKVYGYLCDADGKCTPKHTDDSVPLLNLPLVVLADRNAVSAGDAFTQAVKDMKLGTVIGTRTGGAVSGPAYGYVLNDNSTLRMPSQHGRGANGEDIDGIGVAPDIYLPRTAHDISGGRDPAMAKALTLLH
ncbi:MAG: S41 family peptidase [Spirillospora sp.]